MGSRSIRTTRCERDNWNYFHGKGRRHAIRRGDLKRKFEKMVREGMTARTVARYFMAQVVCDNSVHPDSYKFLLRHGVEYKPHRWSQPPKWGEPKRKRCFGNSAILLRSHARHLETHPGYGKQIRESTFVYVEGVAIGPMVRPMAHAWNAHGIKGKKAVDWTFYAVNNRTTYLGLALSSKEYEELCEVIYPWLKSSPRNHPQYKRNHRPHHIQVFGTDYFARIDFRLLLRDILQRRKLVDKKKPLRATH